MQSKQAIAVVSKQRRAPKVKLRLCFLRTNEGESKPRIGLTWERKCDNLDTAAYWLILKFRKKNLLFFSFAYSFQKATQQMVAGHDLTIVLAYLWYKCEDDDESLKMTPLFSRLAPFSQHSSSFSFPSSTRPCCFSTACSRRPGTCQFLRLERLC